jgi:hypothetical protein
MIFKDRKHFEETLAKSVEGMKAVLKKSEDDEPHKDLHKHISVIEHRNEGEVNSDWTIHTHGGKKHEAHSVDGESPRWTHNDESVSDSHPEVGKILDKTYDHLHSKQCDSSVCHTIHDGSGKKLADKSHEMC